MYKLRQQAVGPWFREEKETSMGKNLKKKKTQKEILQNINIALSEYRIIDHLIFSVYFLCFSLFYNMYNAHSCITGLKKPRET